MTLLSQLLSDAAIVGMDEPPDGPDVVLKLLGERQGLAHQSRTRCLNVLFKRSI